MWAEQRYYGRQPRERSDRVWLVLWALVALGLAAAALYIFVVEPRRADDGRAATAQPRAETQATATTETAAAEGSGEGSGVAGATASGKSRKGVIVSGGTSLLPAANGSLRRFDGQRVVGRGVRVLQIVANEGFWVGNARRRVFVELALGGESRFQLRRGDRVSFVGRVHRNPRNISGALGVSRFEGKRLLRRQGVHIETRYLRIARR